MQKKVPTQTDRPAAWLEAQWPAPANIRAGTSRRMGGVSSEVYASLNLAGHVGDDPAAVEQNRTLLGKLLKLPNPPLWLNQIHSDKIVIASSTQNVAADGCYTTDKSRVCAVLTADCVPLLICNRQGNEIAAIHVGWRGFCSGIVKNAVETFKSPQKQLLAWIGPHIGQQHYEVGDEVRQACLAVSEEMQAAFVQSRPAHWFANLEYLVRMALEMHGIKNIYASGVCNYSEQGTFFSYRRDGVTGRMASLIWMLD